METLHPLRLNVAVGAPDSATVSLIDPMTEVVLGVTVIVSVAELESTGLKVAVTASSQVLCGNRAVYVASPNEVTRFPQAVFA